MAKNTITLSIEEGRSLLQRLKSKGIIPSHLVEELLVYEDSLTGDDIIKSKDELIYSLKLKVAKLSEEIEKNNLSYENSTKLKDLEIKNLTNQYSKENLKFKEEIEELKKKLEKNPKEKLREEILTSVW